MKLQNLAIIFAVIVIPITIVLSLMISNRASTVKTEMYYESALQTATRDGIKALEYNSFESRFLSISDTITRDVKSTINTFLNSLSMNLRLGDAGVDYLKPYVPAIAHIMYDGYYIYTPDVLIADIYEDDGTLIDSREVLEHSLKPYIYYTREYRRGSTRLVVNYTLDNFINTYTYRGIGDYEYRGGYIVDTSKVSLDGRTVDGVTITNNEAIEFYKQARKFTDEMKLEFSGAWDCIDEGYTVTNLFGSGSEPGSIFYAERMVTLRDTIQSTLNAAIGNYNKVSQGLGITYNFKMPILTDKDWEIALSNISLITFFQGVNIGTKYYNGYSVVSSFANSYYTPESELCFFINGDSEKTLHKIDCNNLTDNIAKIATVIKRVNEEIPTDEPRWKIF